MKTFKTMFKTELKLSIRGMDMFIFAICMPIVIVILLGIIYDNKPAFDGADYTFLQQSFGAVSSISICAGGLMGLPLVISDYRSKNILKRFKVTPVSPHMILFVQLTIYAIYSFVSLLLIYLVTSIFFDFRIIGSTFKYFISFILVMLSMFSIGLMVGGIAPNAKIAGVIASILYFPMLTLSGTTLPYEIMPVPLQKFSNILPLTQGIKLLKGTSLGLPLENIFFPIFLMFIIIAICAFISIRFFKWE